MRITRLRDMPLFVVSGSAISTVWRVAGWIAWPHAPTPECYYGATTVFVSGWRRTLAPHRPLLLDYARDIT